MKKWLCSQVNFDGAAEVKALVYRAVTGTIDGMVGYMMHHPSHLVHVVYMKMNVGCLITVSD